jgi:hypothetical protein
MIAILHLLAILVSNLLRSRRQLGVENLFSPTPVEYRLEAYTSPSATERL